MNEWKKYKEEKPTQKGFYEWRIPSKTIEGMFLIVAEKMRYRLACNNMVLSPEFDYWDGYKVVVPDAEWRGEPLEGVESFKIIGIEGLAISNCGYCKNIPKVSALQLRSICGSTILRNDPSMFNRFKFECCSWGTTPYLESPFEVEERRRDSAAKICADYMKWRPIDTAPKNDGAKVTVGWWEDGEWYECDDEKLDGTWYQHEQCYQHFLSVGKPIGSVGPKEKAPYQYWRPRIKIPAEENTDEI